MADCGTSPYQAIAYRGLFDLSDAQVLRAEIVSIDSEANAAEVTLLDVCEAAAWIDLSAVPFFYHCEDSTGTIEDLARGYLAFAVGDMVYLIANKENGDTPAQAYIVGHVDIRGTERCVPPEYLVITLAFTYKSVARSFVTIYDASTGAKIDLDEFENLDGSPDKPASLPAATADVSSWQTYNLEAVTAAYPFLGTISCTSRSYWLDWYGSASSDTTDAPYTGQAHALCSGFSTGNEAYTYTVTTTYTGNNAYSQPVDYSNEVANERTGVEKYELGDTYCRAYWESITVGLIEDHQQDRNQVGTIVSRGTHALWYNVNRAYDRQTTVTITGTTTEIESAAYDYSCSFLLNDSITSDTISGFSLSQDLTWASSVTGTLSTTPVWDGTVREVTRTTSTSSTSALNAFPDYASDTITNPETYRLCPWLTTMANSSNCFKVGQYYVYGLIGAISVEQWYANSEHSVTQYVGYDGVLGVWPSTVIGQPNTAGGGIFFKIVPRSGTAVAAIPGGVAPVDPETYIYLYDCIQSSNTTKAAGLNTVINELIDYTVEACAPSSTSDYNSLLTVLRNGPTAVVRRRKEG